MSTEAAIPRRTPCPSPEVLLDQSQWSNGNAGTLASHLEQCEACTAILHAGLLDVGAFEVLRRENPLRAFEREAELQSLLARFGPPTIVADDATQAAGFDTTAGTFSYLPARIGGYEILGELASGGMGIIYRARQAGLKRDVALKMLLPQSRRPELLERFRLESQAIARLQHPQIVQIFELGEHGRHPYFSMELMEGGDLERRLRSESLSQEQAADLTALLADAVQYSHHKGILHRDLKPSNVLFTAEGTPKIGDFGLAKCLEDGDQGLTQTDAVLGTPGYMAPEQARNAGREIGPATDVYGLGGLLYRMLAGRPPFKTESKLQTLELVQRQPPVAPSRYNDRVCADLEAICLKCLAKSPQQRYSTAAELAADLRRWRAGEMPHARQERRQRRTRVLALATLLPLLLALAAWVTAATLLARFDPEMQRDLLENHLHAGRAVTLVGATGQPRWHRLTGEPGAADVLKVGYDGTVTVESRGPTFVVLVEDPQQDHYRFRAEIRHNLAGRADCGAGLFVGLREHPLAAETLQSAVLLRFSDLRDRRESVDTLRRVQPDLALPDISGNLLQFMPYLQLARPDLPEPLEAKLAGADLAFEPAYDGQRWRTLEVEVHPDRLLARWDEGDERLELNPADVHDRAAARLKTWYDRFDVPPPHPLPVPNLRGGLGIYLRNSSVSFRNVSVQPLAAPAGEAR